MKYLTSLTSLVCIMLLASCGGSTENNQKEEKPNSRDEIRLKQYKVEGAKIYATYCTNCHQDNGKGLAALYPPLAGSDYLLENISRAACIIKN
ncbi:MAG: c-type cytochrome, partial [Cyclobacteriaceae bacterium]